MYTQIVMHKRMLRHAKVWERTNHGLERVGVCDSIRVVPGEAEPFVATTINKQDEVVPHPTLERATCADSASYECLSMPAIHDSDIKSRLVSIDQHMTRRACDTKGEREVPKLMAFSQVYRCERLVRGGGRFFAAHPEALLQP